MPGPCPHARRERNVETAKTHSLLFYKFFSRQVTPREDPPLPLLNFDLRRQRPARRRCCDGTWLRISRTRAAAPACQTREIPGVVQPGCSLDLLCEHYCTEGSQWALNLILFGCTTLGNSFFDLLCGPCFHSL